MHLASTLLAIIAALTLSEVRAIANTNPKILQS